MTAQALLHAATAASATRVQPRRPGLAFWAAALTLLVALLGAGVGMTGTLPDLCPVVALAH